MYSRGGANAAGYGGGQKHPQQQQQQQPQQQPYASKSAYSHDLGPSYSVGGPEGSSQLSMASRHSSMLSGSKEPDLQGYRGGGHYGGQYSSVYGSAGLSSSQQVPGMSGKGVAASALEGRTGYGSAIPDSPKFKSGDYVSSSSLGYGQKSDLLFSDKTSDYPSMDRRQYGERSSAYAGRDLQDVPASRYGDSISFGRPHQADIYERMDQSSMLRHEILKTQLLQSASLDGVSRQAEYLTTRGPSAHHAAQDLVGYGGRADVEPRSLSYGSQHAPSILGAAPPQRTADDLIYSSSNPGYGISLPPGRDYASGKGLHGASLDSDYPSSLLTDRAGYARELDRREEERRRELLHEREKEREREKARERERERDRERERERQRERDRERERERERKREKEREKERRERDKEREHARGTEARRERSLSRISKDRGERGGSSLTKDSKPARKDSPRREASHRRPSPVREKRREYVCKVYSSSLVEGQRDYLSLDKRYPRLFVSPNCSKVVVRWPGENLRLPLHTPLSFEHSFMGEDAEAKHKEHPNTPEKSEGRTIVWNAKMILMSGLSQNALEELSSDRSYGDRIPHYCNMLRFAVLKKENAFMAIGGPWDTIDGGDPSVDNFSLVQTAIRYAKDITQLDLKNCRNWNPFLEIHYDRIGKDGLFSHKEVTVLFVPDLSDCLPSLEAWREQWIAMRKTIAERESQLLRKKDMPKEKKGGTTDKETESHKKEKGDVKSDKKTVSAATGEATTEISKTQKDDGEQKAVPLAEVEKPDAKKVSEDVQNKEVGASTNSAKTGKKKIIKKVVKQKVSPETKQVSENPATSSDKTEVAAPPPDEFVAAAGDGVKTSARKKVVKKVTVAKKESPSTPQKVETEAEGSKTDLGGGATTSVQDATGKKVTKKKIIKKVVKKKAISGGNEAKNGPEGDTNKDGDKEGVKTVVPGVTEGETTITKVEDKKTPIKSVTPDKSPGNSAIKQSKVDKEERMEVKKGNEKIGKEEKPKEKEKLKDVKKDQKGKDESKTKVKKEVKENKKPEEPPRHPGLFLQLKGGKESRLHSVSLSLDSLLAYTDKDTDESTFEISLFAETLQEMLHYEMGSRLLTFLQKLRLEFVRKRNQRKRQREEESKSSQKKSSAKRLKTDEDSDKSIKTEKDEADDGKATFKEEAGNSAGEEYVKEEQMDQTTDVDDPEEDPEEDEDEEMLDGSPQHDSVNDEKNSEEKSESDVKVKMEVENSDDKKQDTTKENADSKPVTGSASKENEDKLEKKKKEVAVVDKDLLAAFRFFDRNRVGYIRVEDLRLIIHNLGKFTSHRDVKELVQSALLESNTGRDDRILYPKLVKITSSQD